VKKKNDVEVSREGQKTEIKPKVFISYSWTSEEHQDIIRSYAERLMADGVEVVFDLWELQKGQDKYAFMERMVTDPSVTHVLLFSDAEYARKADAREAGAGTESQIISREMYEDVGQTRVVPIVCEHTAEGKPCVPTFVKSRIYVNFTSPEAVNENWEGLIRHLFGRPFYQKPKVGAAPSYLTESRVVLPSASKWLSLKEALLHSKPTVAFLRSDFIDSIISSARSLQAREGNRNVVEVEEWFSTELRSLLPLRDQVAEWILLEANMAPEAEFTPRLLDFLEQLITLKYRQPEETSFSDWWFEASGFFVQEVLLYTVASLVKTGKGTVLREILSSNYPRPEARVTNNRFGDITDFYAFSRTLDNKKARLSLNRISLEADLLKERATRLDLTFRDIMQADLLIYVQSLLKQSRWYPHTLGYAEHGTQFPVFVRAEQHRHFGFLKSILGVDSADELRTQFNAAYEQNRSGGEVFRYSEPIRDLIAFSKWDTRS
jgi:hypothetical protein